MLEEFNLRNKHVAGKDNDAADGLSQLEMKERPLFDIITWGKQNKPLHCENDKEIEVMCSVMMSQLGF